MNAEKKKILAASISVGSNAVLVILKLGTGLLMGSVSVVSEAIHSGVDLFAALIALFAVKKSSQPPDREHAYGHGKYENLSGALEALLILAAAAWIIYESLHKLLIPEPIKAVGWGIAVMLASALINMAVSEMLFRVSRATDSIALEADAWHLRTDVYTSAGVTAGLLAVWWGEKVFPSLHFHWVDPVAAMAVAFLIIRAAWSLTRRSVHDLLDERLPPEEEAWIKLKIREYAPLVRGFHNFRSRKSGPTRFIEFHIKVDGHMSVQESHHFNDAIVKAIKVRFPDSRVMVHMEPCEDVCEAKCLVSCLVKCPDGSLRSRSSTPQQD